jgi:glycosyltransferase involved in cell wall biosynthesis
MGYAPDEPVVGMFGRLIEQKGVDVLLDAFALVRQQHPAAQLLIVGDGKERAALEAQAARLALGDAVGFAGWMEHEAASRMMAVCDVITVPSRWEGFGLVTLEAMSWARPIIASRTSSLPEIVIDGETGRLVPPENAVALADAISELLTDKAHAESLGEAGYRRLVEHFSVDQMVCATLGVYHELIGA